MRAPSSKRTLLALVVCASAVAVAAPIAMRPGVTASPIPRELFVPWGEPANGLGFRATVPDFPGEGIASVAIAPDGATWLLDRLHGRIVRLDERGRIERTVDVAPDAEELAIGPDGVLAAYSPLRARVWLFDENGPAGEVAVPRDFEEVVGISVGASRQVSLSTGYQETHLLGSPSVPQTLASMLAGKREGAAFLADGAGISVVRNEDGRAELLVLVRGEERTVERARHLLGTGVLAARVVGAAGNVACARVEREAKAVPLKVERRVICLDANTGARVVDEALAAPGPFLPRRELAVGGEPARLVHVVAEKTGLRVRSQPLVVGGAR